MFPLLACIHTIDKEKKDMDREKGSYAKIEVAPPCIWAFVVVSCGTTYFYRFANHGEFGTIVLSNIDVLCLIAW